MIRSIAFNVAFYVTTALFLIFCSPLLLAPRRWAVAGLRAHAHTTLWLMRWIVGTEMEVRGREHLPEGAYLVAAKHQSAWDTVALILLFPDPALVMKAELLKIPVYGWFCAKFGMIPIQRETGPSAFGRCSRRHAVVLRTADKYSCSPKERADCQALNRTTNPVFCCSMMRSSCLVCRLH